MSTNNLTVAQQQVLGGNMAGLKPAALATTMKSQAGQASTYAAASATNIVPDRPILEMRVWKARNGHVIHFGRGLHPGDMLHSLDQWVVKDGENVAEAIAAVIALNGLVGEG